ncbi:MAG TPA: MATE family efflux transporter [Rhodanobacteraceae bacterium]|nr:MATE family efflux transporter [Rhodanobacteraceae bacterium]
MRILAFDRARYARETRSTVKLALPLIAGQLSSIGMNAVDVVLAGHYNAHTLAAVAVGANVWLLALVCAIGVMMALPPSVAHLDGAGARGEIGPLFRQALILAGTLGVLLWFGVRHAGPLLHLLGVDVELLPDVQKFLHALSWGAPAVCFYYSLRGLSEGMSWTRPTMFFGFTGLVALIPLGWIFIYGKIGLPALGAQGSGIANAIVLWLQVFAFATYVRLSPRYRPLHLFARFEKPDPRAIFGLLRIGVPMGVTLLMEAGMFSIAALLISRLGTVAVAAHQIAINVASITFMVPLGLALAITVRVGNAVGRNDPHGVRYAGLGGISLTLATQCVASALMLGIPHLIARAYTDTPAVLALAAQLLMLAGAFQFADGIQVASNGALRGLKDTRVPMFITVLAYWGVGMPIGYFLAFHAGWRTPGMWIGLSAGLYAAAILLLTRFARLANRESWKRAKTVSAAS